MKIFNFIKNFWKIAFMKHEDLLAIMNISSRITNVEDIVVKMSKIQDIHIEVIKQISVNQYSISTTQQCIASEIKSINDEKNKSTNESVSLEGDYIFHIDGDDDIFH